MVTKEEKKELEEAIVILNDFIKAGNKLNRIWSESIIVNNVLNRTQYPLESSFDEVMEELDEWRETMVKELRRKADSYIDFDAPFFITYHMVRQTIGFERFKEYCQKKYKYEFTDEFDYDSIDEWEITKRDAKELGFPIK